MSVESSSLTLDVLDAGHPTVYDTTPSFRLFRGRICIISKIMSLEGVAVARAQEWKQQTLAPALGGDAFALEEFSAVLQTMGLAFPWLDSNLSH